MIKLEHGKVTRNNMHIFLRDLSRCQPARFVFYNIITKPEPIPKLPPVEIKIVYDEKPDVESFFEIIELTRIGPIESSYDNFEIAKNEAVIEIKERKNTRIKKIMPHLKLRQIGFVPFLNVDN